MAKPKPWAPPVTIATLFVKLNFIITYFSNKNKEFTNKKLINKKSFSIKSFKKIY